MIKKQRKVNKKSTEKIHPLQRIAFDFRQNFFQKLVSVLRAAIVSKRLQKQYSFTEAELAPCSLLNSKKQSLEFDKIQNI